MKKNVGGRIEWCLCRIKVGKLTGVAKPAVALRSGNECQEGQGELHSVLRLGLIVLVAEVLLVGLVK